jgi:hypothetical protein
MANFFDNDCQFSDSEEEAAPPTLETAMSTKIGFGKHRGTTLGALVQGRKTREYLRWVIANFEGLYDDAREAITMVLDGYKTAKAARQ